VRIILAPAETAVRFAPKCRLREENGVESEIIHQKRPGFLRRLWRDAFAPISDAEGFYRHRALVRLTHWINALCILFLLGSGLNIFNAHPRLYWGKYGADSDPSIFSLGAVDTPSGTVGVTQIGAFHFNTTGVLGWSVADGEYQNRGWPEWLTIPGFQDLADARHWHFLFAWILVVNGFAYLIYSLCVRHFQKDIWPTRADIRAIPRSILDHIKLKHPSGDAARRYNVLQKLAYLGVILLIGLMVVTGLAMSPGMDAFLPWLPDLFGGRQSVRSVHFISASLIVLFVIVHLTEVVLTGPINEVRSMLSGRYRIPREHS
jgi:thiosulfate reductase cytochrome b subunit